MNSLLVITPYLFIFFKGMGSTYTKEEVQLVLSDEWELDAKEVTLGAEIGQGAFGLVMTGYYRNKQVAIKVLKGWFRCI